MRWNFKTTGGEKSKLVELLRVEDEGKVFVFKVEGEAKEIRLSTCDLHMDVEAWTPKRMQAFVNEKIYCLELESEGSSSELNQREIRSLMPGRVLKVLIKAGEEVSENQPLLIIEAMKMENEIRSPRSGKIQQIQVSVGQSLEAQALLLQFERGQGT